MSRTVNRRLALLGGTLGVVALVGVGLALADAPGPVTNTAATGPAVTSAVAAPPSDAQPDATATTAAPPAADPTPAAGAPTTSPTTVAKTSPTTAPPTTKAAPAAAATPTTAPPAPAAPKVAPGQRINPTTADVAAAISQLHQRIPLFAPTDAQLRAFADAVCTSFDQGQTQAQVTATMQQAVSYVQGASLSTADAQYAVGVVVKLRCPGYLP